jgi:hypothetical protein
VDDQLVLRRLTARRFRETCTAIAVSTASSAAARRRGRWAGQKYRYLRIFCPDTARDEGMQTRTAERQSTGTADPSTGGGNSEDILPAREKPRSHGVTWGGAMHRLRVSDARKRRRREVVLRLILLARDPLDSRFTRLGD